MEFAIIKGLGLGLFLSISVGPIVFTIIKLSMKHGHKAGYAFITGVSLSDFLLVLLGNLAAELVSFALEYKIFIAAAGAILLLIMGLYSFFFGKDPVLDNTDVRLSFSTTQLAKFSLQGFFINILNPAPIFFWLTMGTAFAYLPRDERIVLFATSLAVILTTDVLKVKLAGRIRKWLTPSHLHLIHQVSALILILFGLIIAGGIFFSKYHL